MSSIASYDHLIGLIDCNNFYVSCERVFNPHLLNKPVIVLSSNDGCIVARSKEAKELGIPMGAPFFQWATVIKHNQVITCSSNYSLYANLSQRIMQIIAYFHPDIEIYSIDECFLNFDKYSPDQALLLCKKIKDSILKWVGIPVSIGLGSTKTLAKMANHKAKKEGKEAIFALSTKEQVEQVLQSFAVEDIWGIGRKLTQFLHGKGITTAAMLKNLPDLWLKKHLTVVGLRLVWELRGIACLEVHELPTPKKSIICSRSFGRPTTEKRDLAEAIATYATQAAEKMRGEGSVAHFIEIFIMTSSHQEQDYYFKAIQLFFLNLPIIRPL